MSEERKQAAEELYGNVGQFANPDVDVTSERGTNSQTDRESQQSDHSLTMQESRQVVTVELPEEHQRFYDKLRKKIEQFVREKGVNDKVAQYILLAPDLFVVLARLMLDKRVTMQAKAIAGVAIAYFITPLDLIPEVLTGPLGLLDDVVLAVYALRRILVDVEPKIVKEHWNGKDDLLDVITNVVKAADELIGQKLLKRVEDAVFKRKQE